MNFKPLPLLYNAEGKLRTVGFELEFSNLRVEECVCIIKELYGGEEQSEGKFMKKVVNSRLGDFTVEFDLTLLTDKKYRRPFEKYNIRLEDIQLGSVTLEDELEEFLESIVGKIFPYEIATPPVPSPQIEEFEKLRQKLYEHHAEGTGSFLTNAFGTHINVEVPNQKTSTLLNYLRAMVLLYPFLLRAGKTDLARRVSPFIDPYPGIYAELLLSPGYQPDLATFMRDYHRFNPDRNRPLDMYPLFAFMRQDIVSSFRDIGKVKPRNTFHYRLPNSSISMPGWTLASEWNLWVTIEELANEPEKIGLMSKDYLSMKEDTLVGFESKWAKKTAQWLG